MPTRLTRRGLLTAAAAVPLSALLRAQDSGSAGDTARFSSDVKLVNVLASVHDKSGKLVSTLGQDDFDLAEDGRPQKIRYFSHDTDLPLTLGLLVDTSTSQRTVLGDERRASYRFLDTVLRPTDKAFVIHFDRQVELLQDLTSSRPDLEKALDQLELSQNDRPQMNRQGGQGGGQGGGPQRGIGGGGTTLYDSIYLAANDMMKKLQGRKAAILLTDGVDHGSKTSITSAIEYAQRSDVLVYSIYFTGQESSFQPFSRGMGGGMDRRGGMGRYPPRQQEERVDGRKILERISKETGGGFYEVKGKQTIDEIFDRIQEDLRSQYSIGYTSDNLTGREFRRVDVTVKQKNLTVQARNGYYPR